MYGDRSGERLNDIPLTGFRKEELIITTGIGTEIIIRMTESATEEGIMTELNRIITGIPITG